MRGRKVLSSAQGLSWRLRGNPRAGPQPEGLLVLVCIYRKRNAQRVTAFCRSVIESGGRVFLWALDEIATGLESHTVGHGHGSRCELLNNLVEWADPGERDIVVICDDDVEFVRGDIPSLVAKSELCGFLLAQPAHSRDSNISYTFTFRAPWIRARRTRFVEIGPVVVVSAAFRSRVFPMPDDFGMGWGLEVRWHALLGSDESFGIVDDMVIRHLGMVASDYSGTVAERTRRDTILAEYGLVDTKQICRTTGRWWSWQRRPPWTPMGVLNAD